RLQHHRQLARLLLHLDRVAVLDLVGGDGDAAAVDPDMSVAHELARGEDRRHELHAVDDGIEPALEELDEMLARVAAPPDRLGVVAAELALGDVAVIALELLLGRELDAVIGGLAAALAVLAGAVFALVV